MALNAFISFERFWKENGLDLSLLFNLSVSNIL